MALPLAGQAATEDPWESFNRPVFRFNDAVDTYALKPLAQGYRKVTPQFVETGVHNVFRNLWEVGNLANNLLQGKIHDAGVDTSRLLFNTTLGGLGFFDVATPHGPAAQRRRFWPDPGCMGRAKRPVPGAAAAWPELAA